jgi:PPP family 3-phenylpropionic acid transporter
MPIDTSRSPLRSIRFQYLLYFGVLGIYLPYFNLYCYHLDFSGAQIGTLSAVRSLLMVFFSLIWGALADRYHLRRPIYFACLLLTAGVWSLYLTTRDFWPMFWITVLYGVFYAPIISFLEAFTMDALAADKARYGHIRVWGSIGFVLIVIMIGWLIDRFAVRLIIFLILFGFVLQCAGALRMPQIVQAPLPALAAETKGLRQGRFWLFLICGFFMLVSHGAYYGFFSIHLENLGYSNLFIGFSWALASMAEIGVMLNSKTVFRRYSLESVILFSFVVAALRWCILYWVTSPVLVLLSQTLHAVTYGAFHMASILYVDRLTPRESKTLGQAANNAAQYGLGLMIGFFLNGWLYEIIGSSALFLVSALVALFGGAVFGGQIWMSGRSFDHGRSSAPDSDRRPNLREDDL